MGISSKKGKAPAGLPTSNHIHGIASQAPSKTQNAAMVKANRQDKAARKLAKMINRVNVKAGIVPVKVEQSTIVDDFKPAATTRGKITIKGAGKQQRSFKSTVYEMKSDGVPVATVNGQKVILGSQASYDKAGLTLEQVKRNKAAEWLAMSAEEQAQAVEDGFWRYHFTHDKDGHHATHRPVTFSQQLAIEPATGKANNRQYKSIDELLAE